MEIVKRNRKPSCYQREYRPMSNINININQFNYCLVLLQLLLLPIFDAGFPKIIHINNYNDNNKNNITDTNTTTNNKLIKL
eukprot:gene4373-3179_t